MKLWRNYFLIVALMLFPYLAFAEDVGHKIGSWSDYLSGPIAFAVLGGLEMLFRLIKSDKPRSLIRVVASVAHGVAKLVEGLAGALDKVVPDRTK